MIIPRDLIQQVKPFLKRKEFISITGPRQSGKSTFLEIIKGYLVEELNIKKEYIRIITFEDRRLLIEFEKDAISFVRSYIPNKIKRRFYLMIDEFQYAEGGGQRLKLIYDTVKDLDIKIIITGSSSLDIKAKVGKFMVGRMLNFSLYPFNFNEYLRAKNSRLQRIYTEQNRQISKWLFKGGRFEPKKGKDVFSEELSAEFEKFSVWGGYPAVVLAHSDSERKKLLSDIFSNYILKDIKTLLELATEKKLFLLAQYLATQIGNIVVYQNLGQSSGLNYRKLMAYLNILEETFVCKPVKPFFKNRQKELSKNPKIYFVDLGFRNNLLDNMNKLDKRSDNGAIIENSIFIRLNELYEGINRICFWRTKAGAEVDFIVHSKNRLIPIEVKYSNFGSEKMSKSLISFIAHFDPECALVLTKNYRGLVKKGKTKILFFPAYYL